MKTTGVAGMRAPGGVLAHASMLGVRMALARVITRAATRNIKAPSNGPSGRMGARAGAGVLGLILSIACLAQQGPPTTVRFEFGTTLNALLSDTVDARKSKPGDLVRARTTADLKATGGFIIARGTRLVGHVSEVRLASKPGEQARLGLLFDRAELKDGRKIPLQGTLYALAAPQGEPADRGSSAGFGGGLGGNSSVVGDMTSRATSEDTSPLGAPWARREELKSSPGAIGGLNDSGTFYASSRGVFGLEGISLEPSTTPGSGSPVVLADSRTVRLSSGTRMLLAVVNPTASQ